MLIKDQSYRDSNPVDPSLEIIRAQFTGHFLKDNKVKWNFQFHIQIIGDVQHLDWRQNLNSPNGKVYSLLAHDNVGPLNATKTIPLVITYRKPLTKGDSYIFEFEAITDSPYYVSRSWLHKDICVMSKLKFDNACRNATVSYILPKKPRFFERLLPTKVQALPLSPMHPKIKGNEAIYSFQNTEPNQGHSFGVVFRRFMPGYISLIWTLLAILSGILGDAAFHVIQDLFTKHQSSRVFYLRLSQEVDDERTRRNRLVNETFKQKQPKRAAQRGPFAFYNVKAPTSLRTKTNL